MTFAQPNRSSRSSRPHLCPHVGLVGFLLSASHILSMRLLYFLTPNACFCLLGQAAAELVANVAASIIVNFYAKYILLQQPNNTHIHTKQQQKMAPFGAAGVTWMRPPQMVKNTQQQHNQGVSLPRYQMQMNCRRAQSRGSSLLSPYGVGHIQLYCL